MRYALWFLILVPWFLFCGARCGDTAPVEAPEPKGEVVKEPVKEPIKVLSNDEVEYVRTQYHDWITNNVLQNLVQHEDDPRSGAIMKIVHPKENPVVKLIASTLFKDISDMEQQVFDGVYKAIDAQNKVRIWQLQGEYYWFLGKIKERCDKDPTYFRQMVDALNTKPEPKK